MPYTRQLAAIMFTDIVGYTALMGDDENKAFELLGKNRLIQKPIIEQYNGRWIKELGDGVMASFNTVSEAVNAAVKIQEACNAAHDFQLRIGIHLGEVVFENEDVFGDGVNIASRIQSVARPGCIYVSDSVHHNVSNKKDIHTKFVKEETLRNVKDPVRIYEVIIKHDSTVTPESQIPDIPQNSIAVLPFTNMSSEPEQEYFSDGISEDIINRLAQVPGLKVAGHTSSFSFKGKNQDVRQIGEQLNVNHILEGSVRKSGNKLRITAQLIKVADGYNLWSEKFDRVLEDIFDIQDEISMAILNAIKIKLFDADKRNVLKKYTDNPHAYQQYLQGRFYYNKYEFKKAIEHFEVALQIEPGFALAYANIGSSYLHLWFSNILPPEQSLPQMQKATRQSLELDDEIADSHLALARVQLNYEWDFEAATIELKKAIELSPNMAEAHEQYALCLGLSGNYTEAVKHASIAFDLDPFSLMNNYHIAVTYWMAGDFEKVLELGRRLVELEPNFHIGHLVAGGALLALKRYDEAIAEAELAVNQNYGSFTLHHLGMIYGILGEKTKAREVLEKMKSLSITQTGGNFGLAVVYMALGEFDNAFQFFEKAIENHEGNMLYFKYFIRGFPEFEQDKRTKELFEKIGLPS